MTYSQSRHIDAHMKYVYRLLYTLLGIYIILQSTESMQALEYYRNLVGRETF